MCRNLAWCVPRELWVSLNTDTILGRTICPVDKLFGNHEMERDARSGKVLYDVYLIYCSMCVARLHNFWGVVL